MARCMERRSDRSMGFCLSFSLSAAARLFAHRVNSPRDTLMSFMTRNHRL